MSSPLPPLSTYRLQLNSGFTLKDATELVPYLNSLGISAVYASPIFKTHPGSLHGYDITDFSQINPEIGTEKNFEELAAALQKHGMGLILDIVPNHMRINDPANRWWWDVLKNGQDSPYAKYFDIDWDAANGKVILPILDRSVEELIQTEMLRIESQDETSILRFKDLALPLNKKTFQATNFQDVNEILSLQAYRLIHWKRGNKTINYRRFFDIDELAGLRVEDTQVFTDVHQRVLHLIKRGWVTGVRVDHVDGLYDPAKYFSDLIQFFGEKITIFVEKILTGEEKLPPQWPIAGTTGYDFANSLNGVFVDRNQRSTLRDAYQTFTKQQTTASDVIYSSKMQILQTVMISELNSILALLIKIAKLRPSSGYMTEASLRRALQNTIASFPVYRTYIRADEGRVSDSDRGYVHAATGENSPETKLIQSILLMNLPDDLSEEEQSLRNRFVMKFQQVTGPVMAKGVEDTALYRFFPLASLNDVGSNLEDFGYSLETFHDQNCMRLKHWPFSMITTSTHDSKRNEDVRARINVLSEIPEQWSEAIGRWKKNNCFFKSLSEGRLAPDANDEYLLYQTLVGTWPEELTNSALDPLLIEKYTDRIVGYMLKAVKEAKTHTSWIDPVPSYEHAIESFTRHVLNPQLSPQFFEDFCNFIPLVIRCGHYSSLSQVLLKLTSPGTPDIYQGCELWNERLVDPDNRQPVDFRLRKKRLKYVMQSDFYSLSSSLQDGQIKLFITHQALKLRKKLPDLFARGSYIPLEVLGNKARHIITYARERGNLRMITIVARFYTFLGKTPTGKNIWDPTHVRVPNGTYRDALTGRNYKSEGMLSLGEVLASLPFALLEAV